MLACLKGSLAWYWRFFNASAEKLTEREFLFRSPYWYKLLVLLFSYIYIIKVMQGLTIVFTNSITPKRSKVFRAFRPPPPPFYFIFIFFINENIYVP